MIFYIFGLCYEVSSAHLVHLLDLVQVHYSYGAQIDQHTVTYIDFSYDLLHFMKSV